MAGKSYNDYYPESRINYPSPITNYPPGLPPTPKERYNFPGYAKDNS